VFERAALCLTERTQRRVLNPAGPFVRPQNGRGFAR
jgi:hypothetical protein